MVNSGNVYIYKRGERMFAFNNPITESWIRKLCFEYSHSEYWHNYSKINESTKKGELISEEGIGLISFVR